MPNAIPWRMTGEILDEGKGPCYWTLVKVGLPFGASARASMWPRGESGGSDLRGRDGYVELLGDPNQLGQRRDVHLLHDLRPVGFHRAFRGAEFGGDLLVELARDHPGDDGALAGRQGFKARTQTALPFSRGPVVRITNQRVLDRVQERRPLHRLRQEIH